MRAYKTKSGAEQFKPSLEDLQEIAREENNEGFCLACGERAYGIEPDARRYTCECCKAAKVYGAEELLLMGLYH